MNSLVFANSHSKSHVDESLDCACFHLAHTSRVTKEVDPLSKGFVVWDDVQHPTVHSVNPNVDAACKNVEVQVQFVPVRRQTSAWASKPCSGWSYLGNSICHSTTVAKYSSSAWSVEANHLHPPGIFSLFTWYLEESTSANKHLLSRSTVYDMCMPQ